MKLHRVGRAADWDSVDAYRRNFWQQLAARTSGFVTPGNCISLLGGVMVIVGLVYMTSTSFWLGLGVVTLGRVADILDGMVAERTGTKSPLGELLDASIDKIVALIVLLFFIHHHWIPLLPVLCVAVQVVVNSLLAAAARVRGITLHPSAAGKMTAVGSWAVLLIFPIAAATNRAGLHGLYLFLMVFGYVLTVAFAAVVMQAIVGYYRSTTEGLERPGLTTIVCSVTGLRILCALFIVLAAVSGHWGVVLVLALVAFATDYFDGMLARRWKVVSTFGMTFDPIADKVVCLAILAVAGVYIHAWYWLLFVLFLIYDTSTTTLRLTLAEPMPASKIAKYKTALLMVGLIVVILGVHTPALEWFAVLLLVLAVILSFQSLMGYLGAIGRSLSWLEHSTGVTAIDFAGWHKERGIDVVLFDIDGTVAPWQDAHVDDEVVAALKRARKAGIAHVGLVSNMSSRKVERLMAVAEQVGASTYHTPNTPKERKPSPFMIQAALKALDTSPEKAGFVGDKIVDVMAAHRAGVARVAWVERLGTADHPLDRILYRPVERLVRRLVK